MIEKKIVIEEIDPIDLFGVNNRIIDKLCEYYPKCKVAARGYEIFIKGESDQIYDFEKKIESLIDLRKKKNRLSIEDIDYLFGNGVKVDSESDGDFILYGTNGKIIKARTKNQKKLVEEYNNNDLIFAVGPAGTGKTYTAIALAVRALKNKEIRRLILTRPAVEAGERLGFLPGDMREKLDPYLQPLYDALGDMIPSRKLAELMEDGTIQIAPLAFMRGRTLESAFVILDEAQNTTLGQLKMFLTRMGNNSKFIVTGDMSQIDLPKKSDSGLERGIQITDGIKRVITISFQKEDIVRNPIVSHIIEAFDNLENS